VTDAGASTDRRVRILLADDHPAFLAGMQALLRTIPGAEVAGEVTNGAAAIADAHRLKPDIVLMDVNMPGVNGIEATRTIVARCPQISVLILTMVYNDDAVLAAMRAGARGYVLKGAGLDDIRRAIDAVSHGDMIFGPQAAKHVYQHLTRPPTSEVPFPDLTDRERAVLELVADGRGNVAIAVELGLSIKTVRNYLSRIFAKLQVADRTEAAVQARRAGLGN
jgi:DNA-binding NarL/FixJ family response regulator